ncbi:MAG TPA: hypothetical protein VLL06_09415, partial [Nitrospiraceae bacterium]|nr:hypothetical protein [Nitrospiraceae bacterium]
MNEMISFMLGFALVFSSPVGEGFFANWQVPFVGSYSLTIFDALVLPVGIIAFCLYGFRVKPQERFLYGSLSLVILSRIVSLVAGGHVAIEQSVSVFRYVEA